MKHLIVINTYNRIDALNKTIFSINQNLPDADICVISKGDEKKEDILGKITFFHKTKNIGREAHGYIWAFLKYSNYQVYTFLQDEPAEIYGNYYGDKIKIAENLILLGKTDCVSGMFFIFDWDRKYNGEKFKLNSFATDLRIKKRFIWFFNPGSCFTIHSKFLISRKKIFEDNLNRWVLNKNFAWSLERIWQSLSPRNCWVSDSYQIKYSTMSAYLFFIKRVCTKLKISLNDYLHN